MDKSRRGHKSDRSMAPRVDVHVLYERAVQAPEFDIQFIDRVFTREHGRRPMQLREDFCGTAFLSAEWVKSLAGRTAVGVDADRRVLDWGRKKHLEPLGTAARRVRLVQGDVLDVHRPRVDVVAAFNFSYYVFLERNDLLRYATTARQVLRPGGMLILDGHTGSAALAPEEEVRRLRRFTYVWDQRPMNLVTGRARRYIHFRFADGSERTRAFSYDWRMWTVPEVRDVLADAGYSRVDVYVDVGRSVYRRVVRASWEGSQIPYIIGWK